MPTSKPRRGARIALARQRAGFSQQALADHIGAGRQTIARLELDRQVPTVDTALAIAAALGQSVESLFGGDR